MFIFIIRILFNIFMNDLVYAVKQSRLATFRLDYEYEIEYEYDFRISNQ